MWLITETIAPVVFAGEFLVKDETLPLSQNARSVEERILPLRSMCRSGEATSDSRTKTRLSSTPASVSTSVRMPVDLALTSVTIGSRTAHISPSPDDRPLTMRSRSQSGAACSNNPRVRPQLVPLRAFEVLPTSTGQICGG